MHSVQLSTFLNQAQFISHQLSQIRKDLQSNATNTQYPEATASNYIERAINLRLAYRNLADGIEANRTLVQVQKEKIEKSKIYLEGLHYYKTTLIDKIKESQIEVINISQYVDKPIKIDNWNEQFEQKEEEIVGELEDKKKKQKLYERLISEKARKEVQIKEKKELYEKVLPAQAKKILDQIQQTSKYFSIEEYSQFDAISNRDLSAVYDKLNSLRSKKVIELNYSRDEFQELEIVICKNEHKYYKQAVANKVNICDSEIKLTISSFAPHCSKLVIGLDRREDFTNEEVFQRLVNNEPVRPIFLEPRNQLERNINAKYVRLDWLDTLFLTGLLTPEALFELIKERVFCLKLINNLVQNIKKLIFFFPLNTELESPVPNNLKKVSFGSLEKISTEAYLQLAYQPDWLQKYISSVERSDTSMIAEGEDQNRCNLLSFLQALNLEEFLRPNMNTYYKGSLNIHQNVLTFLLIVPFSYPRQKSMIRIVEWHRKKEEDRKPAISDIPCKFHASLQAKVLPDRILEAERAVNSGISCFFKGEEVGNPFRILIQINRLLTLLGECNQRRY